MSCSLLSCRLRVYLTKSYIEEKKSWSTAKWTPTKHGPNSEEHDSLRRAAVIHDDSGRIHPI